MHFWGCAWVVSNPAKCHISMITSSSPVQSPVQSRIQSPVQVLVLPQFCLHMHIRPKTCVLRPTMQLYSSNMCRHNIFTMLLLYCGLWHNTNQELSYTWFPGTCIYMHLYLKGCLLITYICTCTAWLTNPSQLYIVTERCTHLSWAKVGKQHSNSKTIMTSDLNKTVQVTSTREWGTCDWDRNLRNPGECDLGEIIPSCLSIFNSFSTLAEKGQLSALTTLAWLYHWLVIVL